MTAEFVKVACPHCGGHIEFDPANSGIEIECPHCQQAIRLQTSRASTPPPLPPRSTARPHVPPIRTTNCPDCGGICSKRAVLCAHCGAPLAKPGSGVRKRIVVWGAILTALFILVALMAKNGDAPGREAVLRDEQSKQGTRLEFIEKYKRLRALVRIEPTDNGVIVYTGPTFSAADFQSKEAMAGTIWSYYGVERAARGERIKSTELILRDANSGRRIGHYDANGLEME